MARPRRHADTLDAALVLLDAGDREGAVDVSGMSLPTLYRRKAERDAGGRGGLAGGLPGKPAGRPSPPSPPARQPEAVAGPSGDPWWALGEILAARAPELDAVVAAGLETYQREGSAGLRRWLGPPQPLTAEQRGAILESVEAVTDPERAALAQGVAGERWRALLLADVELRRDVEQREAMAEERLCRIAANLDAEDPGAVAAARQALERLARRWPERYAPRQR